MAIDQDGVIRRDRTNHLSPAHLSRIALGNGAADGFENDIAGMQHRALVTVVEGHRAESPFHNHLSQTNIAGLKGNIRDAVNSHPWRHFHPEAGIAGNWKKSLTHRSHVGRQLRLKRVDKNVCTQLDGLNMAVLTQQPRRF